MKPVEWLEAEGLKFEFGVTQLWLLPQKLAAPGGGFQRSPALLREPGGCMGVAGLSVGEGVARARSWDI